MAKNKKKTQKNLLIHSRAKVDLLGAYLKRYLPIIQQSGHAKRLQLLDLFCSEGIYQNGGKGSPFIILEAIKEQNGKPVRNGKRRSPYRVVFNDYDAAKITKLQSHVSASKLDQLPNVEVLYRQKDYKDIVDKLPSYMRGHEDEEFFIFIDPYGYKEIEAAEIKRLLSTGNSEVLLFQPTQSMYRFVGGQRPDNLERFIEEVLPDETATYETVFDFIDAIKSGFQLYMGPNAFVDTFTIRRDAGTTYTLFFFSQHIRGFEKMLEAKWELDKEEGRGWSYERTLDMFSQPGRGNVLEDLLTEYLRTKRTNKDLYQYVLRKGYLPTHCNQVLKNLQQKNRLLAVNNDAKPLRKGAFYVTYESFKQQDIKGFFTYK